MNTLLFVYGTLKRGCQNHHHLAGQAFVGPARTRPGLTLCDLGGFPTIVTRAADTQGVVGEVWSVDDDALRRLDAFEGVHEGLYRRERIQLEPPFADREVDVYVSAVPVTDRPEIGSEWIER